MQDRDEGDTGRGRESRYAQESWTAGNYGDRPQLSSQRIHDAQDSGQSGVAPKDDSWHTHAEEEPAQPAGRRGWLRRLFGR